MAMATSLLILLTSILLLVLVAYNGCTLLWVSRQCYRFEYEKRKGRQLAKLIANVSMLSVFVAICFSALLQKYCLFYESRSGSECPLEYFHFAYFEPQSMSVHTKLKLVGLWLLYSAIIILPMFVFLLFDQPDDNFSAYGRGSANTYSIFQYNKLERERKMEHRIGKHFLREEEKNLLLEKQKFGLLSGNEEIRL